MLLAAGVSFTGRRLRFNYSGDPAAAPPGYRGKTVPGAYLNAEVYPLAFTGQRGIGANLGIGAVFDRVLSLKSAVDDGAGGTTTVPTRESRYGARVMYRHNVGDGPTGLSLVASAGYNKMAFVIAKGQAPDGVIVDVPNVVYTYIDPGLGARIPITGRLSALLDARFLAVLDTGEIQKPEQYGTATVTGADLDGALEYGVGDHFLVRAGARVLFMGFAFKGTGALTDRDANTMTDVGGASDRYLGGYVLGGYSF